MKIAIVCGHFIPSLGYIEVHLSQAFAKMGHTSYVITSDKIPTYIRTQINTFGTNPSGVQVKRLRSHFSFRQIVVARGIKNSLLEISPELIIVIGLGKIFPKPVFDCDFKAVCLLGDNAHSYSRSVFLSKLIFNAIKKKTYKMAIDRCHKLIAYTPESFDVVGKMLSKKYNSILHKQQNFISLGFWPHEFFFNLPLRIQKRVHLGFRESDIIIVTATRVVPEKNLENGIKLFQKLSDDFKWLIIGKSDNTYSTQFENTLKKSIPGRFKFLPHAPRAELNGWYNAGDIAFYTLPAISIFEAAGAGLPLVIPESKSLKLIAEKTVSHTYRDIMKLNADLFYELLNQNGDRAIICQSIQSQFSWPAIAQRVLDISLSDNDLFVSTSYT